MQSNFPDDPLQLIPDVLPSKLRTLLSENDVARCRSLASKHRWAREAHALALCEAQQTKLPDTGQVALTHSAGNQAVNLAIMALLENRRDWAQSVIRFLHELSHRYGSFVQKPDGARIIEELHAEQMFLARLAEAYDLCSDLADAESSVRNEIEHHLFRPALEDVVCYPVHMLCDNHHTTALLAMLAIGAALGDKKILHSAFYGYTNRNGQPNAGIAHQIEHDFLGDGLDWERAPDYHFYMLYCLARMAWIAKRIGTDLWQKKWSAPTSSEGLPYNHDDYDAPGTKRLIDYFVAPLYLAQSDWSMARIGDSAERHIYELSLWGPIFESAWAQSGDERFAWLLTQQYKNTQRELGLEYSPRGQGDGLFVWPYHYIFVEREELPEGKFDLTKDTEICLTGRHENGCTLFASSGFAVLRANASQPKSSNITMVYGAHHAGHQHPDLLSFSWHVDGKRVLLDTENFGYGDPEHGSWDNHTVAHNTVLMDGLSQQPQGDTDYLWMTHPGSDVPRGTLLDFVSGQSLKAVAAQTDNAYAGKVLLRRALLLTEDYLFDCFDCVSDEEHQWDYALQPCADVRSTLDLQPYTEALGDHHGLRQLKNIHSATMAKTHNSSFSAIEWSEYSARFWCSHDATLFTATHPVPKLENGATVLIRQRGASVGFRGIFSRHNAKLTIELEDYSESNRDRNSALDKKFSITGSNFQDTISFVEQGLKWIRHNGISGDEKPHEEHIISLRGDAK
jgi:hypothetical protein